MTFLSCFCRVTPFYTSVGAFQLGRLRPPSRALFKVSSVIISEHPLAAANSTIFFARESLNAFYAASNFARLALYEASISSAVLVSTFFSSYFFSCCLTGALTPGLAAVLFGDLPTGWRWFVLFIAVLRDCMFIYITIIAYFFYNLHSISLKFISTKTSLKFAK